MNPHVPDQHALHHTAPRYTTLHHTAIHKIYLAKPPILEINYRVPDQHGGIFKASSKNAVAQLYAQLMTMK